MPHLDEAADHLLQPGRKVGRYVKSAWAGFCDYALKDNVLEVAIGLIIAAAFTSVTNSFVSDIIMPILSLLPFIGRNFDEKFAVLKAGPNAADGYNTIKQAQDDGAIIMSYGAFINKIFNFLGVGISLYLIGLLYGYMSGDTVIKIQVRCKYCRKWISSKARRCPECSTWMDGREDVVT